MRDSVELAGELQEARSSSSNSMLLLLLYKPAILDTGERRQLPAPAKLLGKFNKNEKNFKMTDKNVLKKII